jgi:hypothetical protein
MKRSTCAIIIGLLSLAFSIRFTVVGHSEHRSDPLQKEVEVDLLPQEDHFLPSEPTWNNSLASPFSTSDLPDQFFRQNSTWTEKISDHPQLLERLGCTSESFITDVLSNSQILTISYREWSVPIWYAKEDTPAQWVELSRPKGPEEWQWVPIPSEAQPAAAEDAHMVIVSYDHRYAWDFWHATKHADGHWSADAFRRWDLTTDGINSPYDGLGSSRVAPVPLLHGLITYDEIVNKGTINHALAFAYSQAKRDSPGVYPCETSNNGYCDRACCLWLGFRLQLNPDLDLDSLNLNPASKIIAKAMQEYGMIFVENNGVGYNSIYAENLDAKAETWNGILDGTITNIPLDQFRVVEPIIPSDPSPVEDVNRDGVVNILDTQICVNVMLSIEEDPALVQRADVNLDGEVDIADVDQIVAAIIAKH